jgi:hypothetical protein
MTFIAVTVDPACGLDEGDAERACQAADEQAREFADAWGVDYTPVIHFSPDVLAQLEGEELDMFVRGARLCTVQPDLNVPGALGYHDDIAGVIFARVKFGPEWTVTLSHEVLEEIGDPTCDEYTPLSDGRQQAKEACDRVEGDTYRVQGQLLSNYLLPAAFEPGSAGPWDKLAQLTRWDGMTGGGYMIVRNADGSEVEVLAETAHARARVVAKMALTEGRLARRLAGPTSVTDVTKVPPEPAPSREQIADAEQELVAASKAAKPRRRRA